MELSWNEIKLDDKKRMEQYYCYRKTRGCEMSYSNNFLWAPHYHTKWGIVDECMVFYDDVHDIVSMPVGKEPYKALETVIAWFQERGAEFKMHSITAEMFAELENKYPDKFVIEYDRDSADYIYEAESLGTLAGKKLHAKRNHINRFIEMHPEWQYEEITENNLEECIAMAEKWRVLNKCDEDENKEKELCVTLRALKLHKQLELRGGLIRTKEGVVAFSLGAPLSDDTFVVHIEKAFGEMQGAYPIINREFVLHAAKGYKYINREEDMGDEGLRKAKLSYRPAILLEKGVVRLK